MSLPALVFLSTNTAAVLLQRDPLRYSSATWGAAKQMGREPKNLWDSHSVPKTNECAPRPPRGAQSSSAPIELYGA